MVSLAPLSDADTARLIAALLGRAVDQDEAHATLLGRIGGNPLYAEQVCRMLDDRGLLERDGATVRLTAADTILPDSIQALIAARLDTLTPEGRALLQDAAVVGTVFWSGALVAIGGRDPAATEATLEELARRAFIRAARGSSVAARASTPSGTTSPARWPTASSRGRPGSPSTGPSPPGSSRSPATGSPTMPSCSPTTT
jgi:predicted ATPase